MAPVLGGTRPTYVIGTWGGSRDASGAIASRTRHPAVPLSRLRCHRIADPPSHHPASGAIASRTRQNEDLPEQERYVDCDITAAMSRPPRIKGFGYLGAYRYFITFCTLDRTCVFTDIRLGQSVMWQFRRTCREKKFAI